MSTSNGKIMVVTGANTGIGYQTALALSRQGVRVLAHARTEAKAREAAERLATGAAAAAGREAGELVPVWGDFASLDEVENLAQQILSRAEKIDVLVNNAGAVFSPRQESRDGFELTFAVNHLATFLLTHRLLDRIKLSAPSRIVTLSSAAHQRGRLDLDDLQSTRRYTMFGAYGASKLANLLFSKELAVRLEGTGVTSNSVHPGVVFTRFGRDGDAGGGFDWLMGMAKPFLISPERGARTSVHVATAPELEGVSGEYFIRSKVARPSKSGRDAELAKALWEKTVELLGDRL
ncbi:MAG: SDR family oxidoreductase [Deltaproteobacteria bacterium]|nr:SDR family oxidoreductase [Deltaproteobacteria bacterium]